jgi:beta-ribofuranosylaminobenzene 5'-phosphate synthase
LSTDFVVNAPHQPNQASIQQANVSTIQVLTSARLHMGFFDLHGGMGRRFGSLGVSLQAPQLRLSLRRAEQSSARGEDAERALAIAQKLLAHIHLPQDYLPQAVALEVQQAIPAHAGLGSGTQMALAVGSAINQAFNLNMSLADIAHLTQRAARSGIGLGTFAYGGLIVDGGRSEQTVVPPVISHMAFPDWPILLILQTDHQGVHGAEELKAFDTLPEFSADDAQRLCREVLMRALPAIHEKDLSAFATAVQTLQAICGDYFAPAQGGGRYASPLVTDALHFLKQQGVACFGQSSWGPTGFAVLPDEATAQRLCALAQQHFAGSGLQWLVTKACNHPAQILER